MTALPPNLTLLPVTRNDAPELVNVYFDAFQNAHSLVGWPRVPTVRKWWEDMLARECQEENAHMLKIVDHPNGPADTVNSIGNATRMNSNGQKIVAFVKWVNPRPDVEIDRNLPEWPEGSDKELNQTKFGQLIQRRIEIMGTRENHWYLEIIAVDPSYQGRGLGSILLGWGTSRADAEGIDCYVEASPAGLPLYRKFDFAQRDEKTDYVEVEIPGYGPERDLCLVRSTRSGGFAKA